MRITTIIPAYNSEAYIGAALDSVFAQTRPSDEIIVVDDGSTDQTPLILAGYGTRIRIITQRNTGPSAALNVALAGATGDVIGFLDSDDLWLPAKLEIQSAVLMADSGIEAVFGHIRQFASKELHPAVARGYIVNNALQPGISKTTMLIRRVALDRIGHFLDSQKAGDFFEWYSRARALGFQWCMLPEVVSLRRHHPGNIGRLMRALQQEETLLAIKQSLDLRRRRSASS